MKKCLFPIFTIICPFYILFSHYNLNAAGFMRNISSMEIVADMKIGWNLGNTLDATGGSGLNTETSWGNPFTTKAIIDAIKAKGFNTIRIPVTWNKHFGAAPDYTIDQAWLDRVEEVVNYVLDNGMYAILNSHHDEWITLTTSSQTQITTQLTAIWTQVANRFKDYSDYLVFETMNEPRLYGSQYEWSGGTTEARDVLNSYNAAVVSAMRATGGNNALRHIMIPTHAATAMAIAQDALVIPANDSRIIVSQHTYWPYNFSMQEPGTNTWGTESDKSACDDELDRIYNKFGKNGIPVVIGEWGSINKNNTAARAIHAEYYAQAVRERGMLSVWWDNGWAGDGGFSLLDRTSLSWIFPEIAEGLIRGVENVTSIKNESLRENLIHKSIVYKAGIVNFVLSRKSSISLSIYDTQGKTVFNLVKLNQPAGNYEVKIPAYSMSNGCYMLKLKTDKYFVTNSFALLR